MIEILKEVLATPYLWQSLGLVSATSIFVSPILYSGDYRGALKTLIVIGLYAAFCSFVIFSHMKFVLGCSGCIWIRPLILIGLVGVAYVFGLIIGTIINRIYIKK